MHVLNRALEAIPHPSLTSSLGPQKILKDFKAVHKNDVITYEVNIDGIVDEWNNLTFMTPETGSVKHEVKTEMISDRLVRVSINVKDLVLYGIIS
jgi:hypothetical protein